MILMGLACRATSLSSSSALSVALMTGGTICATRFPVLPGADLREFSVSAPSFDNWVSSYSANVPANAMAVFDCSTSRALVRAGSSSLSKRDV